MSSPKRASSSEEVNAIATTAEKRVILSMGGKGGVGKTSVMAGLAEWFAANQIPVKLLDLDTENKARGSLTHFFGGGVPKVNIHTPAGLDSFVDQLADGPPVILADMGAGAGQVTYDWFEKMYPDVSDAGIVFTAVGVVTSDPASVESVLAWAARLQNRVEYLIVENGITEHADFTYWRESDQAQHFQRVFRPAVIHMDYRLAELENATRNHGVTLGDVAARATNAPELRRASLVMRAQSYRRRMFAEFESVKELLFAVKAMADLPEADLIDRIANALPLEVRADYYRELRHCRSLPENDEMLRILRVMQFSVLLMVQAPVRMAAERERLEQIFASAIKTLQGLRQSSEAHQAQLDRRLAGLPAEIAEGIRPEAIAGTINESLRQQFVQSTIPETAQALTVAAAQMKKATADFGRTASTLGDSYRGAAEEARQAIGTLESTSSHAISSTKRGAEELLRIFHQEYRWSLYVLSSLALVIGIGLGMMFQHWIDPPVQRVERAPVMQPVPTMKPRIKP